MGVVVRTEAAGERAIGPVAEEVANPAEVGREPVVGGVPSRGSR
jgi:hypothetical protein